MQEIIVKVDRELYKIHSDGVVLQIKNWYVATMKISPGA